MEIFIASLIEINSWNAPESIVPEKYSIFDTGRKQIVTDSTSETYRQIVNKIIGIYSSYLT